MTKREQPCTISSTAETPPLACTSITRPRLRFGNTDHSVMGAPRTQLVAGGKGRHGTPSARGLAEEAPVVEEAPAAAAAVSRPASQFVHLRLPGWQFTVQPIGGVEFLQGQPRWQVAAHKQAPAVPLSGAFLGAAPDADSPAAATGFSCTCCLCATAACVFCCRSSSSASIPSIPSSRRSPFSSTTSSSHTSISSTDSRVAADRYSPLCLALSSLRFAFAVSFAPFSL